MGRSRATATAPTIRSRSSMACVHCGCIAHARRKFFEAIKALPKKEQKSATAAHEAVRRIDELYKIERESSALSDAERAAVRTRKIRSRYSNRSIRGPADLQVQTLPVGQARRSARVSAQTMAQADPLHRATADVAIDTNLAENAIRPFALGRRNWLFADTVSGAQASAHLYSLVQTARANELEPYAYLRRLFAELPAAQTVEQIEALLPFRSMN